MWPYQRKGSTENTASRITWTKTGAVSHVMNESTRRKFIISTIYNPFGAWETAVLEANRLFIPKNITRPILILNASSRKEAEKQHYRAMSDFQNQDVSKLTRIYQFEGVLAGSQFLYSELDDEDEATQHSKDIGHHFEDRVLCEDGACIGTLNSKGICTTCGRAPDEVRAGIANKALDPSLFEYVNRSSRGNWSGCPLCGGKGELEYRILNSAGIFFPIVLLGRLIYWLFNRNPTLVCKQCSHKYKLSS